MVTPPPPGTVRELVSRQVAARASAPAIRCRGEAPLGYDALSGLCDLTSDVLLQHGVGRDQRVAVVMPNGPEMAVVCLAVMTSAVCVPLNPAYTQAELEALLVRLGVSLVLVEGAQTSARRAATTLGVPILDVRSDPTVASAFLFAGAGRTGVPDASAAAAPAGPASPEDLALVLHTSGSTAEPKVVPLSHRNLIESAGNVARSLQLGPDDLCLSAMPLFHVGALVDLLLAPLMVGGTVLVARDMVASHVLELMKLEKPTWYQGVPTMLQDLLRHAYEHGVPGSGQGLRFVRSVSSPLPERTLRELEELFAVPVLEIYGMTEAAGVITSNPLPPAERRIGSVGLAAGPEVAVVDRAGNPAPPGVRGEVLVRGPSVVSGYETTPGVQGDDLLGGWLRTGDEGYLDADGYLYLTGRVKDIINRGGEKIAPHEIDEHLLRHPDVAEAAAFALPHPTLGEQVAIAVVPAPGRSVDAVVVKDFCHQRLAPFKVPQQVFVCASLPRAPGGKLQRSRLPDWCALEPRGGRRASHGPANPRQRRLVELWEEVLDVAPVDIHDDFVDLGGDSLRAVELALKMSEQLGVDVQAAALYDHPTIAMLEPHLESLDGRAPAARAPDAEGAMLDEVRALVTTWEGKRATPDSLLVGWNTAGERPPLFWGVQGFGELRLLAEQLGPEQPVWGMRSLYETQSKSPENATRLAERYRAELERLQPEGPVLLGGYCAGGGVALEVARQLRAAGRDVPLLALFEHFQAEPYAGPTAYFFAVESGWHPFSTRDTDWLRACDGPVTLHPSRSAHIDILRDPGAIRALATELAGVTRGAGAHRGLAAQVEADVPRALVSRSEHVLRLELSNQGEATWPAHTAIFARWGRPGSRRLFFDGVVALEDPLRPGDRASVPLDVRAPLAPGPWRFEVQIVCGGDWQGGLVTTALTRTVQILPGPAVWSYLRQRLPRPAALSVALRRLTGRTV